MIALLQIVLGIILISWLIALCFKSFRDILPERITAWFDLITDIKEEKINNFTDVLLILFICIIFIFLSFIIIPIFPFFFAIGTINDYIIEKESKEREERLNKIEQQKKEEEDWFNKRIQSYFTFTGKEPFDFDPDTFLYLESEYNKSINECIGSNLNEICAIFKQFGFRFIYLPKWQPSTENISLAHLSIDEEKNVKNFLEKVDTVTYTKLLCKTLRIKESEIDSGIFHFACYIYDEHDYEKANPRLRKFTLFSIQDINNENYKDFFKIYCKAITEGRKQPGGCYFSVVSKWHGWDFFERHGDSPEKYADYTFLESMKDIADNIKKEMEQLKEGGYYELLLHTLGDEIKQLLSDVKPIPSLSHLKITDDYKIWLVDYNKEVKMTPLQKTLYIFYLRHPEGVEFKMLSAYYDELLAIYKVLSNRENLQKQEESIRRLVDVTDNAINEKCSRIKEAFLKITDDFIARNYYIVLKKQRYEEDPVIGYYLLKQIILPRNLVTYPKDIERIKIMNPIEGKKSIKENLKKQSKLYDQLRNHFYDKKYPKGQLIEEYTEFINNNPKFYKAYFQRAILYAHIGKFRESMADNDFLISHNEKLWTEAIINKAEDLFFLKEYELALKTANHFFEIESSPTSECYRIRASIYKKLKMYEEYSADKHNQKRLQKEEKKRKY